MSKNNIFPLRNVRGPEETTRCKICPSLIEPGQGFSVMEKGNVVGYVCDDCFMLFKGTEQEGTDGIFYISVA